MPKGIEALQEDIRELEKLVEQARRDMPTDPEAAYALALLEQCLDARRERLRRALH